MGYRLLSQIGMITVSLFVVFTIIIPKLEAIKLVQEETAEYQRAVENASQYNQKLAQLVSKKDSFTRDQLQSLERYVPASVDDIRVMADLQTMTDQSGLTLVGVAVRGDDDEGSDRSSEFQYNEEGEEYLPEVEVTKNADFTLNVRGTYSQLKQLLGSFEYNAYPLEIVNLTFSSVIKEEVADGVIVTQTDPEFDYALTLRTYSFSN